MGACLSTSPEVASSAVDAAIDRKNRSDAEKEQSKIKLLLLGAGESGKSTIFKQMRVLYGKGYSDDERRAMLPVIYCNIMCNMRLLLAATTAEIDGHFATLGEAAQEAALAFRSLSDDSHVNEGVARLVAVLWADPAVKAAAVARDHFHLADSAPYFFNHVGRVCLPGYIPSVEDVLRSRVRTSGILAEEYVIDGAPFDIFDVGGQKNERRKWIHAFDDVTAIIFVAAIAEYDQVMFEDTNVNRLEDSLKLFGDVCNSRYFENTSVILFLNKRDIFAEKIAAGIPLRQPNPDSFAAEREPILNADYNGGQDLGAATQYIVNKFLARNRNPRKEIFYRVTCATDTDNVATVFSAAKDIILKQNLSNSGLFL